METTSTPRTVVYIVVGALAMMAVSYLITLEICMLRGIEPKGDAVRALEAAGMYVLGAFTGILVNTRSAHQGDKPIQTEIVNKPDQPVPTTET